MSFMLYFSRYSSLFFEHIVRYSSLRGCHRDCYSVASIFMRIGLFIGGFYTIERVYSPNYKKPDKPPSTIISNHLSMLDIAFILSEFGVTSFVARVSNSYLS